MKTKTSRTRLGVSPPSTRRLPSLTSDIPLPRLLSLVEAKKAMGIEFFELIGLIRRREVAALHDPRGRHTFLLPSTVAAYCARGQQ